MLKRTQEPQRAPDWGQLIADVVGTGLSHGDIGSRMGAMLTTRMLRHYAEGVQPVHFRGEALIALWCERMKSERAELPTLAVVRGHRAARPKVVDVSPQMRNAQALMEAIKPPVQRLVKAIARKAVPKAAKAKAAK